MRKSLALVVASAIILSLFLSACGSVPGPSDIGPLPSDNPVTGGQIVFGITENPIAFNPLLQTDTSSELVSARVYNGLVKVNEQMELIPDLAEKWEFSPDGLVWTFTLRKGILWHDGNPFTSADVKYTYDAIKSPDYLGLKKIDFKPITQIECLDDYTVRIHLDEPCAPLLSKLTVGIIPKHVWETTAVGEMKDNPANTYPIGTGAYKFVEWQKDQQIILEANKDYFGEGPYIQKMIWNFYENDQDMLAALEKGDIDYMDNLAQDDVERVRPILAGKYDLRQIPQNGYMYIGLKQTDPVFRDKLARQALMYGTDRAKIVQEVLQGFGDVMNANLPKPSWAYADDELNPYEFNPEKAKQLLDEAGWKVGTDGIREKNGQKMDIKLLTSAGDEIFEAALLIIQQNWKDLGVNMVVEYIDWTVLCSQYLDVARFQSYALGWKLGLDPDCYLHFHSSSAVDENGNLTGFNDVEFKNDELDELLELGRTEMDPEIRRQIYVRVQKIVNEELPYIFLYAVNTPAVIASKIKGVVWGADGPIFPEMWWIHPS